MHEPTANVRHARSFDAGPGRGRRERAAILPITALVGLALAGTGCRIEVVDCRADPDAAAGPADAQPAIDARTAIDAREGADARVDTQQVPPMTGDTTPSGRVARSGAYGPSYEAWQAFDASDTSMWISATFEPAWISYEWTDGPRTITAYAIDFVNGTLTSRAPRDFTLEGWDGRSWTLVDRRIGETDWLGSERRQYEVTAPGPYPRYRLRVTDDNDDRAGVVVTSMGRLELIGHR